MITSAVLEEMQKDAGESYQRTKASKNQFSLSLSPTNKGQGNSAQKGLPE